MRKKYLLSVIFLMLWFIEGYSQFNLGCLTKSSLQKIQLSNLTDIRIFLNKQYWYFNGAKSNYDFQYFDYPINYNMVTWVKMNSYGEENILLYNITGKSNIVIYQSNFSCFNQLISQFDKSKGKSYIYKDRLVTLYYENNQTIEFREYINDESRRKYSILVYNPFSLTKEIQKQAELYKKEKDKELEYKNEINREIKEADSLFEHNDFENAKVKYASVLRKEFSECLENKIKSCDSLICEKKIHQGDLFSNNNDYENALKFYNDAREYNIKLSLIKNKIDDVQKRLLLRNIERLKNKADDLYKEKNFTLALGKYNELIILDSNNIYAKQKIIEVKEIINMLSLRGVKTFSYSKLNYDHYTQFKTSIYNSINKIINEEKNGYFKYSSYILFDTSGNNRSRIDFLNTSLANIEKNIFDPLLNPSIKSSMFLDYYLASEDKVNVDVKWNSSRILYRSNKNGIIPLQYSSNKLNSIDQFINSMPNKYGRYTFEIKEKYFDNKLFSDINLVKYNNIGPLGALYSFFIPGLGSIKTSYGSKGWGRFTSFLLFTSLAIGSKFYSDSQYSRYLGSSNPSELNLLYERANLSNQISITCAGISTSIYLYDIFWALSRGTKNSIFSKSIKRKMLTGPIQIQNQPLPIK